MTTRKILATAAAFLLTASLASATADAAEARIDMSAAYSATRIIESGKDRIEQRYFQQGATTNRMETELQGQQSIMIMRGDRNLMWTIMPAQRMYMEFSLDAGPAQAMEIPDAEGWRLERVGREAVNGVPATKYRAIAPEQDGTTMQGYMWITADGIPVRMDLADGKDRVLMELRDLVVGPQPAALFEPPAGYQRLAVGAGSGGMLDGLKGMKSGPPGAAPAAGAPGDHREPGFVDELATDAAEEARQATRDEVGDTVRDSVRKGLRSLLPGRK